MFVTRVTCLGFGGCFLGNVAKQALAGGLHAGGTSGGACPPIST